MTIAAVSARLQDAVNSTSAALRLDLSAVGTLDTNAAAVLDAVVRERRSAGTEAEIVAVPGRFVSIVDAVSHLDRKGEPEPPRQPLLAMFERTGETAVEQYREAALLLSFLGSVVVSLGRVVLRPGRVRWKALVTQMEQTGLNSLPIVGLLSFLVGVVTAFQSADQLAKFGAEIFTVNIVGLGILREMGVLITSIIVAGRSGSAFTAQIGTMKVNQEVDALQTLGLDPMDVLVTPRVLGLVLVMPLLVFYANILGVLGGAIMATFALDISLGQFVRQFQIAVPIDAFWVGMVKAPLFAAIIAVVGCFQGMMVSQSAESVGRRTTMAVVQGVFLIIVLDAMLSVFFSLVGI